MLLHTLLLYLRLPVEKLNFYKIYAEVSDGIPVPYLFWLQLLLWLSLGLFSTQPEYIHQ